jgi:Transglutaminase-like superfamily
MIWWKLLTHKYQTILSLSEAERAVLVRAMCLLPIVSMSVQFRGLRFTQALLIRLQPEARSIIDPAESEIWEIVRMVKIAVRYNRPWANCLKQSLVLWFLLRDRGIMSELRIGVQRESDKFSAHAWVEHQGIVLNDTDDVHQRFHAFDRVFEQPVKEKS